MRFTSVVFAIVSVGCVFGACPSGWVQHAQSCYKFQPDHESWVGAMLMCRLHKSDLIAIETKAEQDWFATEARSYNLTGDDEGFWLGATDWEVEGTWVWESASNAPLTAYSVWGSAQPNNRENRENCLAALHYFDFAWSDEYCDDLQIMYVCEKKAIKDAVVG